MNKFLFHFFILLSVNCSSFIFTMDPLSNVNRVFLNACKNNKDIEPWIEKGADPKCIDPETGCNGLHYACKHGNLERIEYLLGCGLDVNKKSNIGTFPLYVLFSEFVEGADGSKRFKITNLLLQHGADITLKGPRNHGLFAIAVANQDIECMKLFKEKGIDIHCVSDLSFNVLSEAVCFGNGRLDIVRQLFEWGCKPIRDAEGFSLLHFAVRYNNIEIARYLIAEKGFNVNDCTNDKQTSLHLACENANLDMIKLVLEAGAKVNVIDKDGKTPLQLSNGNPLLTSHLKSVPLLFREAQKAPKDNQQKSVTASSSIAQSGQKKTAEKTVTDKKQNKKAKNNQKKKKKKEANSKVKKEEKVVIEKPQQIVAEVPVIEERKEKAGNKEKKKEKTVESLVGKIAKKLDKVKMVLKTTKTQVTGNQEESVLSRKNVDLMRSFAQVTAPPQVIQQRFAMPARETIIFDDRYLRIETQVDLRLRNMLGPIADNPLMNVPWSLHVQEKNSNDCDFFHNFSLKVDKELGLFVEKEELGDGTIQYAIRAKVETIYGNRYEGRFEYIIKKRRMKHRQFLPDKPKNNLLALTDK